MKTSVLDGMGQVPQNLALQFMLAGRCDCVLHSTKTGDNIEFKITKKESNSSDRGKFIWFINYVEGGSSKYAGMLWFDGSTNQYRYSQGQKGALSDKTLQIRSLMHVVNKLHLGMHVEFLEVYHIGKCGVCGRKLTDPESIIRGIGPVCVSKVMLPKGRINKG